MSIFEEFNTETMKLLADYCESEKMDFELYLKDGIDYSSIIGVIHELKGVRHVIAKLEYEYDKKKIEYDKKVIELKYSDEYTKYKSLTQKQEQAEQECIEDKRVLLDYDNQLRHLKANRDGLTDELKLLYKYFEQQGMMQYEDIKTDESRSR